MSQELFETLEMLDGEIHDLSEKKVTKLQSRPLTEHLFYLLSIINRILRLMIIENVEEKQHE